MWQEENMGHNTDSLTLTPAVAYLCSYLDFLGLKGDQV